MKKSILFLCVMLLNVLVLSSCSKDEDGANGGFDVNGEGYTLDCEECEDGVVDNEEGIFVSASFSALLYNGPDIYNFVIRLGSLSNFNSLKVGDDISDIVWIRSYRNMIDLSEEDFDENISGKLIVKSISGSNITLEFTEFTFIKLLKGTNTETYKMNGSITFRRI